MKKLMFCVAVLALLIGCLAGCSPSYQKGDTTVLLTVGGIEVTHEQYRFICMKNASILAGKEEDYFTGEDKDAHLKLLEESIEQELRMYCAIETMAEKYDVSLSDDDKDLLKEEIKGMKEAAESKQAYHEQFEKAFMSEHVFYLQTKNYYLERNLFYHIIEESNAIVLLSDDQLREDVKKHFFAANQILLQGEDAEDQAQALLERIKGGEDFTELAKEYSKDNLKDVRYFTTGEMQSYFEDTVKELEIGEVSEPVKSSLGVHLIKREALDMDYVEKNLATFRDTDLVRIYNEMMAKEANSLKIVYTDAYQGIIWE